MPKNKTPDEAVEVALIPHTVFIGGQDRVVMASDEDDLARKIAKIHLELSPH